MDTYQEKDEFLIVRVPRGLKEKVKAYSLLHDRTMSSTTRTALTRQLEEDSRLQLNA